MSLLLEVGCDTILKCDIGLTWWDLADELERTTGPAAIAVASSDGSSCGGGTGAIPTRSSKQRKEQSGSMSSAARSKRRHVGGDKKGRKGSATATATTIVAKGEVRLLPPSRSPRSITL